MRESVGVNKSTVARLFNVRLRSLSVSLNKPVMVCNKLCLVYLTGLTHTFLYTFIPGWLALEEAW